MSLKRKYYKKVEEIYRPVQKCHLVDLDLDKRNSYCIFVYNLCVNLYFIYIVQVQQETEFKNKFIGFISLTYFYTPPNEFANRIMFSLVRLSVINIP